MLRHENHLHRQIDTAVKMLNKDVPQLYARRVRDQVLEEAMISERECREDARGGTGIDLETRGCLRRIRKATEQALCTLAQAPLDTAPAADAECQNEPSYPPGAAAMETGAADEGETAEEELDVGGWEAAAHTRCRIEPARWRGWRACATGWASGSPGIGTGG